MSKPDKKKSKKSLVGYVRCKVKDIKHAHFYTTSNDMKDHQYFLCENPILDIKRVGYRKICVTIKEL